MAERIEKYNNKKQLIYAEPVVIFNERTSNQYIPVVDMDKVNELVTKVSTDMYTACDSAGWYWWKNKINDYADKDDIIGVSALVNNPSAKGKKTSDGINGYEKRRKYCDLLKIIFEYENCK